MLDGRRANSCLLLAVAHQRAEKGVGEIGIVGTAAIANGVYHATGVRVRDLPITLDKLLRNAPGEN